MYKDAAMETLITRTIRSAMAQEGMTYSDLCDALAKNGIVQSESTLRSKVNNGTMAASLFIHVMNSTNANTIDLAKLMERYRSIREDN
ncbi:MAG: DUF6471 domain-containing protein [Pseudomonadales bacterium]